VGGGQSCQLTNVLTDCHLTSSIRRTQPWCWLFKQKLKEKEKTKETKKKKEKRRKQENNKKRGGRERNGTRWWTFQNKNGLWKTPFDKSKAELTWRRSKHREKVNARKRSKRKETIEMEEAIKETQERTRHCNLSIKNKVKETIINHHTNGKKEVKS
jgi:cell division protein FtsI/penicillin-binding protein 2